MARAAGRPLIMCSLVVEAGELQLMAMMDHTGPYLRMMTKSGPIRSWHTVLPVKGNTDLYVLAARHPSTKISWIDAVADVIGPVEAIACIRGKS